MEMLSVLLALSEEGPQSADEGPGMRSVNAFFDLSVNKLLNKQSRCQ